MTDKQDLLRNLPKIDALMLRDDVAANARTLGHRLVADICREAVASAKQKAIADHLLPSEADIVAAILAACGRHRSGMVGRVINGTGVLLHTNLGRAPLGRALFEEMAELLSGYCNIEIDILERRRGVRAPGVSNLLCQACGAEDAVVVNNNAAALFLILMTFASDKEVVISRSELVQIGGGFRIPSILESAGALLREVGTTNITTLTDYRNAVGDRTALVLKVHHANFRMEGFVESVGIQALREGGLGDVLIVADLGSGNIARKVGDLPLSEPTPADWLTAGADLVCFSCDKMLGCVQGGVIAGRADLVDRIRKHPVMRVVRVDKITYAALQIVLRKHLAGRAETVPFLGMAALSASAVRARVEDFIMRHDLNRDTFRAVVCDATFGGGASPGLKIPSYGLSIRTRQSADDIAKMLQGREPPIIGTVRDGVFLLDFRTILAEDEAEVALACQAIG